MHARRLNYSTLKTGICLFVLFYSVHNALWLKLSIWLKHMESMFVCGEGDGEEREAGR